MLMDNESYNHRVRQLIILLIDNGKLITNNYGTMQKYTQQIKS